MPLTQPLRDSLLRSGRGSKLVGALHALQVYGPSGAIRECRMEWLADHQGRCEGDRHRRHGPP